MMSDPRYPIGRFSLQGEITREQIAGFIDDIEAAPKNLRTAVAGLTDEQLDTQYREGGWTVRQVVHHVADSHMNAYMRHRLTLTEDSPTIKPYNQELWAGLPDARIVPPGVSLTLLASLHHRWVVLLRSVTPEDFSRTFTHPESGPVRLDRNLGLYAWHGRHHAAQITSLREREGWK
jgi:DinB superfamily